MEYIYDYVYLLIIAIIWEVFQNEFVNSIESQTFLGRLPNSHHDKGIIAEWRFFIAFFLFELKLKFALEEIRSYINFKIEYIE